MCGICGYYGADGRFNSAMLRNMNEVIFRRGPDEDGYFLSSGVGLAMRRLSILDIQHGQQPVFNEDKSICTVFNGEIYNYREIKKYLISRGHNFTTNSDTEVIVHLYEEYGKDLVHHLRGMFAFALWDNNNQTLLLARDRLGIKPLFYSNIGGKLVFASEIKCLLASGVVSRDIDYQAMDAYFTYTYVPAPYTIYESIRKLEPGHLMLINSSGLKVEQYWDLDFSSQDESKSEKEWMEIFDEAIYDSVSAHLVSDVPLGAFLSGGVDSSLVVSMMSAASASDVETFTLGFDERAGSLLDERKYAKLLARKCRLKYNEFSVVPNFEDIIGEVVSAFDEPFADDSVIPSYYISKLTRKKVKVALSGLGGDELFAGYHRYYGLYISRLYGFVPSFIHKHVIKPFAYRIPEPRDGGDKINHIKRFLHSVESPPADRYLGYVSTLDECGRRKLYRPDIAKQINYKETNNIILNKFRKCNSDNIIDKMLYADIKTYLPDDILALSDRLSMWHSLELRVPFVDHKLVELSARLPAKYKINILGKKRLLKKVAKQWMPNDIINHRKQGFESPMAGWLRNELYEFTNDLLSESNIRKMDIFDYGFVKNILDAHFSGKEKNNKCIFSLIMFAMWQEQNKG